MKLDEIIYKTICCADDAFDKVGKGKDAIEYSQAFNKILKASPDLVVALWLLGPITSFVVEGKVLVEMKVAAKLNYRHLTSAKKDILGNQIPVALVFNFGSKTLQYEKVINPEYASGKISDSVFHKKNWADPSDLPPSPKK